jgi:hypothetical protein
MSLVRSADPASTNCSGGMYEYVPMPVAEGVSRRLVPYAFARPKSVIFTTPRRVIIRLPGLMSRCTIPWLLPMAALAWTWAMPRQNCTAYDSTWGVARGHSLSRSDCRSVPSTYSRKRKGCPSSSR